MRKFTLRLARTKVGLTQSEMANLLGVSRNTYNQYENYKTAMQIGTAIKFSNIVGFSLDELIFLQDKYTSSV